MRFLTDENIAGHTVAFLKSWGHTVDRVPLSASDQEIASLAESSGSILITRDEDFLHFLPSPQWGIVFIYIHPSLAEHITAAVERLLKAVEPDRYFGKTIILRRDDYEIFG